MKLEDTKYIEYLWADPIARTQAFFEESPFYHITDKKIDAYQIGPYLSMWGELYGNRTNPRIITVTGRGTGKTSIWQELNGADIACFMPYFLQLYYGSKKPIDVTIILIANVKKSSKHRLDRIKSLIRSNPFLERQLIDYQAWTKEEIVLKNGTLICSESASDRVRGYHSKHEHGRVIYFLDEFAFFGGASCMDGQKFVEEVAEQSFGASIGCFTTPYGKRGGAWWAFNHPSWAVFRFPTWVNPKKNKAELAAYIKQQNLLGRQMIVDQEVRGQFVDDAGLFFTIEIWMKSLNTNLEWIVSNPDSYAMTVTELNDLIEKRTKRQGYFLLGLDPNGDGKKSGADPFGIALTEKVGKKYYNRFTASYHGKSHDQIMRIVKPLCAIFEPKKITLDGGGGYDSGPRVMLKGQPGVSNIDSMPESNISIVTYMSMLRSLMAMGRYEQPPSESLRESQMAMGLVGDYDMEPAVNTLVKFQTRGKHFGIPCDLAAMGLSVAREMVSSHEIVLTSDTVPNIKFPHQKQIESQRVLQQFDRFADMELEHTYPRLTGVEI